MIKIEGKTSAITGLMLQPPFTQTHVHTHAYKHMHPNNTNIHISTYKHRYMCTHTHTHIYTPILQTCLDMHTLKKTHIADGPEKAIA